MPRTIEEQRAAWGLASVSNSESTSISVPVRSHTRNFSTDSIAVASDDDNGTNFTGVSDGIKSKGFDTEIDESVTTASDSVNTDTSHANLTSFKKPSANPVSDKSKWVNAISRVMNFSSTKVESSSPSKSDANIRSLAMPTDKAPINSAPAVVAPIPIAHVAMPNLTLPDSSSLPSADISVANNKPTVSQSSAASAKSSWGLK
jgi:hypothetical protein